MLLPFPSKLGILSTEVFANANCRPSHPLRSLLPSSGHLKRLLRHDIVFIVFIVFIFALFKSEFMRDSSRHLRRSRTRAPRKIFSRHKGC